jgi:hypothetical protein
VRLVGLLARAFVPLLSVDDQVSFTDQLTDLDQGQAPPRTWLSYRLQSDRVGLHHTVHRLHLSSDGDVLVSSPRPGDPRPHVATLLHAMAGSSSHALLADACRRALSSAPRLASPAAAHRWALALLEVDVADPSAARRAFRDRVRTDHPDVSTRFDHRLSGVRLAQLVEARDLLLTGPHPPAN